MTFCGFTNEAWKVIEIQRQETFLHHLRHINWIPEKFYFLEWLNSRFSKWSRCHNSWVTNDDPVRSTMPVTALSNYLCNVVFWVHQHFSMMMIADGISHTNWDLWSYWAAEDTTSVPNQMPKLVSAAQLRMRISIIWHKILSKIDFYLHIKHVKKSL